ncbi:hypothetical protein PABG_11750 [Paracoccidioides brasiliensis Pb03]|uniref:Uncharacterized protein n=1 Tax=Paracoccidioides brasiliensis TaxID=121759 RepID=A0A1D2JL56_PARBR|nr:hypothetical protein PABG_11750 [Paracoccidioides brasiliensis Pb03]ODH40664.1 hypothetical protein ACO22_01558 [Paracoccidioides brasiliensis]
MPMGKHEDRILDCSIPLVIKDIKGKSVIMAGGASGLGRPFVEAFTKAGCVYSPSAPEVPIGRRVNGRKENNSLTRMAPK